MEKDSDTLYAERYELLLKMFPSPYGRPWKPSELVERSEGRLSNAYLSSLRRGKIGKPGFEQLSLLAELMGFDATLWRLDPEELALLGSDGSFGSAQAPDYASLFEELFADHLNPGTGKPFTEAEVAEASNGRLTREEVAHIRTGALKKPSMGKLMVLSEIFGVRPSHWSRRQDRLPLVDPKTLDLLEDQRSRALLQSAHQLSDEDKDTILLIVEAMKTKNRSE